MSSMPVAAGRTGRGKRLLLPLDQEVWGTS